MNVCLCVSPNWLKYIPIELYAFCVNNPGEHTIYLISHNIPPTDITYLEGLVARFNCTLNYIEHNVEYPSRGTGRFTVYTLWRLSIPFLLNVDKVLYLDADTLVVGDISELYSLDLKHNHIAGAKDNGISQSHRRKYHIHKTYINAGVILMNLDAIRESGTHTKWREMIAAQAYPCNDQDIINITSQHKTLVVSPLYNASLSTALPPRNKIRIMHYAGIKDPWVKLLPYPELWYSWEKQWQANLVT